MGMRVHESWRKRHIAKIDHFRVARNRNGASNIDNLVALHEDNAVRDKRFRFSIEHPRRFQDDGLISGVGCNGRKQKYYNDGKIIRTRRDWHLVRLGIIPVNGKKERPCFGSNASIQSQRMKTPPLGCAVLLALVITSAVLVLFAQNAATHGIALSERIASGHSGL